MCGLLSDIAARCHHLRLGLLKGPALWGDIYKPGERESCDIDLYIADGDLGPLLTVLSEFGYQVVTGGREESPLDNFKTVCLSDSYGDLSIEIHTRLWWREPLTFKWHWRAASPAPLLRLSLEDQLLHLCGHWIAQHTMISMHWMFDIVLFLEKYSGAVDFEILRSRAKALRLVRAVELALQICDDFSQGREARVRDLIKVDLEFLLEPRKNLGRYFLIKHAVQESWLDAFLYDVHWLRARLGLPQ